MTSPITCILTDDEPFARKGIQGYVEKIDFLELRGVCEDALQLGRLLQQQTVDLLFLDIQMPHLNGIEFLQSIRQPPKVIFTTAFEQYAIRGFELDVLDYLLKPISFDRFMKAAYKAQDYFSVRQVTAPAVPYFFVKAEGKLEKIVFADILFIEGMENYGVIQLENKRIITHTTLKSLLEKLPEGAFLQTHKSYIVAASRVERIDGNVLHIGKYQVPMSRNLRDQVLSAIIK
jgi:DNA-binding LytR/AlgR family response regulator